ncbi:hypothetical protein [Cerasicoccus frondis]|uniref:hypothetical protein n=1 Tax=Cerasicoccus frondis TaxID=490090 RepID=UPI0028527454|nr:hypothetical protein [Cerasicoccus frondis]
MSQICLKNLCNVILLFSLSVALFGAEDEKMVVYRLAGQSGAPNFDAEIDSLSIESLPYILDQIRQDDFYRSKQAIYILSRKLEQFRGELSEDEVDAMVAVITSRIEKDPRLMKSSFLAHTVAHIDNPQVVQLAQRLESSDDEEISAAANRVLITRGIIDAPTQDIEQEGDLSSSIQEHGRDLLLAAGIVLLLGISAVYRKSQKKQSERVSSP